MSMFGGLALPDPPKDGDPKHCGKLTDHDGHTWYGQKNRVDWWCKGWIALDGATRPEGNTREFEEKKRG